MTLEEAIRYHEEEAEKMKLHKKVNEIILGTETYERKLQENTQTAEWLKELAERRKQPEIIRCKDCKHYHTDVCGSELGIGGMYENIIVANDACDRWTKGMNCVEPEGFCFLAERNE